MDKNIRLKKENKVIIILIIAIILVASLILIILLNTKKDMVLEKDIKNIIEYGHTNIIYVENSDSKKCKNCKEIEKYLNEKKINYVLYDVKKKTNKEYKEMLQNLTINPNDFGYPAIIYVKEGKLYSDIININNTKTIDNFIKNYKLNEVK